MELIAFPSLPTPRARYNLAVGHHFLVGSCLLQAPTQASLCQLSPCVNNGLKRAGQIVDAATAVAVPPSVVVPVHTRLSCGERWHKHGGNFDAMLPPRLRQVMRLCHWRQGPREGTTVPQICALSTQPQHIGVNLCMRRQRTFRRLRAQRSESIEHERQNLP